MRSDVAHYQQVVLDRRATLALWRRFRPRNRTAMIPLEAALGAAERHLALLQDRQAAWLRDRTFERDLIERVLLMARIADFREASALALDRARSDGIDLEAAAYAWPAAPLTGSQPDGSPADGSPADGSPAVTTLAAVIRYLRTHHPPRG